MFYLVRRLLKKKGGNIPDIGMEDFFIGIVCAGPHFLAKNRMKILMEFDPEKATHIS